MVVLLLLPKSKSGTGDGGSIKIEAESLQLTNNGQINTTAIKDERKKFQTQHIGNAGDIEIAAKKVRLSQSSEINSFADNSAKNAGDINIKADEILAFSQSNIFAFSEKGIGGNVSLDTPAFFGEGYFGNSSGTPEELRNNDRVDVNASGAISGGSITIPDVSNIQNNLTQLSTNAIDTNTLIANSCLARSKRKQGSFTLVGGGGFAYTPADVPSAVYPTSEVKSAPPSPTANSLDHIQEAIEPLGVYQLENGEMILGRECQ